MVVAALLEFLNQVFSNTSLLIALVGCKNVSVAQKANRWSST
jgi:hypothetical protein